MKNAVSWFVFGDSPTFRRDILPLSSGPKSRTSKKPAEAGGSWESSDVLLFDLLFDPENAGDVHPKRRHLSELDGGTTQKTIFLFILSKFRHYPSICPEGLGEVSWGGVGWDWVHLVRRPLIGSLYEPRMMDEYGAFGGMRTDWRNFSTRRKPAPVPHCPPQIPQSLTQDRTRSSAVESRRLTTWARPSIVTHTPDNSNNNHIFKISYHKIVTSEGDLQIFGSETCKYQACWPWTPSLHPS
jgi:hypothetical protein